jgi:hypothetical protein
MFMLIYRNKINIHEIIYHFQYVFHSTFSPELLLPWHKDRAISIGNTFATCIYM